VKPGEAKVRIRVLYHTESMKACECDGDVEAYFDDISDLVAVSL
jgi:hypothetical protein